MGEQLEELRDRIIGAEDGLCSRGKERLKLWKREVDPRDQKLLHVEGEKELLGMGERWHARLPQLFDDHHESEFRFRATVKQRAKESVVRSQLGLSCLVLDSWKLNSVFNFRDTTHLTSPKFT